MNKHKVEIWCGWDEGYKEFEFSDYDLKNELTIDGESIFDRDKRIISEEFDKYKWHDLKKNPEDLPKKPARCLVKHPSGFIDCGVYEGKWFCDLDEYVAGSDKKVVAWREI